MQFGMQSDAAVKSVRGQMAMVNPSAAPVISTKIPLLLLTSGLPNADLPKLYDALLQAGGGVTRLVQC